jgi:hypothetical protein
VAWIVLGRARGERSKGFQESNSEEIERRRLRVSDRDGRRAAERRAERIRWRKRSRSTSQTSRNMDEHLRQMNEQASLLDRRLHRHGEDSENWHRKWDDPSEA